MNDITQNSSLGTSTHAQRARLLSWLEAGPIDTITARRELNILMPAARIKELKERGYSIQAQRISMTDEQGRTHHGIALYYLSTDAAPTQAEA